MIVRGTHRVLVQGITGKQGTFWTEAMQAYGTNVVGGVNPNKAGTSHLGVPVFATARDAPRDRLRHRSHVHPARGGEGGGDRRLRSRGER
jgi:succinyl-CoA synthetase alpha subunit